MTLVKGLNGAVKYGGKHPWHIEATVWVKAGMTGNTQHQLRCVDLQNVCRSDKAYVTLEGQFPDTYCH